MAAGTKHTPFRELGLGLSVRCCVMCPDSFPLAYPDRAIVISIGDSYDFTTTKQLLLLVILAQKENSKAVNRDTVEVGLNSYRLPTYSPRMPNQHNNNAVVAGLFLGEFWKKLRLFSL